MPRCSDWRIVWDPEGESPRVLLDFDDELEAEIEMPSEQLVAQRRSDFAVSSIPLSRANVRRRLEFRRRDDHPTAAAGWEACAAAVVADVWEKGELSIEPRGGTVRNYTAALMNASHEPLSGYPAGKSLHSYAFRVSPAAVLGPPIAIIAGAYNPAGSIQIELPEGHGVDPGDDVRVDDVPRVPDGTYPVTGVAGNLVTIAVPSSAAPGGSFPTANVAVAMHDPPNTSHVNASVIVHVRAIGLLDGASYVAELHHSPGGVLTVETLALTPIFGVATGNLGLGYTYRSIYGDDGWTWGSDYSPYPLPLVGEGQRYPRAPESDPDGDVVWLQTTGTNSLFVVLKRNGTEIDRIGIRPNWACSASKNTDPQAFSDSGRIITLDVVGPGGGAANPPDVPCLDWDASGPYRGTVRAIITP